MKAIEQEVVIGKCLELKEGSGIFALVMSNPQNIEFEPGQFLKLEPRAPCSLIERPFSVYSTKLDNVTILIKVVGPNTKAYSELQVGGKVKMLGPLGQLIPIDSKAGHYILVAGGIGAVPLASFSNKAIQQNKRVTVLLGGEDESQIVGVSDFNSYGCEVKQITETGEGKTGLVTDLLEDELREDNGKSVVVACGPKLMLKKVAEITTETGNECWVVLEGMMACGVGSCKSCAVFGIDETVKHICADGPAFEASWIDWDKLAPQEIITPIRASKKINEPMKTILKGQKEREIVLEFPTMNGSGCLDLKAMQESTVDISKIGALVTKGIKLEPWLGNPTPRVCEMPMGLINSIGLESVGLEEFIQNQLPQWLEFNKPIIANISGSSLEEFVEMAVRLVDNGVRILEVNVSCPNVEGEGVAFGKSSKITFSVTRAVRQAVPETFIIVKLTPEAGDIVDVARAAKEAGADAISLINTLTGMVIDIYSRKPKIGKSFGGMSGPAIRPRAVKLVYDVVSANLGIPIIGIGGINSAEAAAEFLMVGAQAIGIGTELLKNPDIFTEIDDGFVGIMRFHQVNHIQDLVGAVIMPK